MRNVTVKFVDGSSHIYSNVPDDVTPEQVTDRANTDFGLEVTALDGGQKSFFGSVKDTAADFGRFVAEDVGLVAHKSVVDGMDGMQPSPKQKPPAFADIVGNQKEARTEKLNPIDVQIKAKRDSYNPVNINKFIADYTATGKSSAEAAQKLSEYKANGFDLNDVLAGMVDAPRKLDMRMATVGEAMAEKVKRDQAIKDRAERSKTNPAWAEIKDFSGQVIPGVAQAVGSAIRGENTSAPETGIEKKAQEWIDVSDQLLEQASLGGANKNVLSAGQSVGYSLATMAPMIASWPGWVASAGMMYRGAQNQFMSQLRGVYEDQNGRVTDRAWDEIKNKINSESRNYGLYETIPELVSDKIFFGIVGKVVGSKTIGELTSRIVSGEMLNFANESSSEALTQQGQNKNMYAAMKKLGISGGEDLNRSMLSPGDWWKSYQEVAPAVAIQQAAMFLGGVGAIKGGKAINNLYLKDRLKRKLEESIAGGNHLNISNGELGLRIKQAENNGWDDIGAQLKAEANRRAPVITDSQVADSVLSANSVGDAIAAANAVIDTAENSKTASSEISAGGESYSVNPDINDSADLNEIIREAGTLNGEQNASSRLGNAPSDGGDINSQGSVRVDDNGRTGIQPTDTGISGDSVGQDIPIGSGTARGDALNWGGVRNIHATNTAKELSDEFGLDADTAEKLSGSRFGMANDSVTGLIEGRRRDKNGLDGREFATSEAEKYVARTGDKAFWAQMDIANLGGLNEFFGNNNEKADIHFKAISDIAIDELRKTGAVVDGIRTGGDEFGALIVGGNKENIDAALEVAKQRIKEYADNNGFGNIIHPKYKDDNSRRGVGVHFGVAQIHAGVKPVEVYDKAIEELDFRKKGGANVGRIAGQVRDGEVQDAGQGQGLGNVAGEQQAGANEAAKPQARASATTEELTRRIQQNKDALQSAPDAKAVQSGESQGQGAPSSQVTPKPLTTKPVVSQKQESVNDKPERAGVRQYVEALIKRRSAANQMGKSRSFDNALAAAKSLLNGEDVKPSKFRNALLALSKDKAINDALMALHDIAKANVQNKAETVGETRQESSTGAAKSDGEKTDLLGDNTAQQQAIADATLAKDEKRNAGESNASDFTLTGSDRPADQAAARGARDLFAAADSNKLEDVGEKLGGAKKDKAQALRDAVSRELSDSEIASMPLSKIWPKESIDEITDTFTAAVAHTARAEVPAKPRKSYAVKAWVEKVKALRDLVQVILEDGASKEKFIKLLDVRTSLGMETTRNGFSFPLRRFKDKLNLLEKIDREQWDRIGTVELYPSAYRYDADGMQVPVPQANVTIDDKRNSFNTVNIDEIADKAKALLAGEKEAKRMEFEVRGREGAYFINKKGDKLYRKLKTFATSKEALEYRNANYNELVAAWDAVKESDNVKETDVRNKDNRPRTGQDYRKGKDVSADEFKDTFGFRGVEFGNYVAQGVGGKERQGMINQAYDALMDLANIIGVPPKAISLNGSLGLGFGSRGSGWASAHYEPNTLVINLTKTRGAGTLGHEWFHALDNYFQRDRIAAGASSEMLAGGHSGDFITYKPENYYINPRGMKISQRDFKAATDHTVEANHNGTEVEKRAARYRPLIGDPEQWKLQEGVRPEVAEAFADLVDALNKSPMTKRARLIDAGKSSGYWSRIIEVAARSFESYMIHKMQLQGFHNDYLVNVKKQEEFARDIGRFPYLLEGEVAPVAEAFDNLFSTIKTKETDKGVALFSRNAIDTYSKHSIAPRDVPIGDWAGRILFHGTSDAGAESIHKDGVDIEKSTGGYFGKGFYMATDAELAADNYADFAEDDDSEGDGSVVAVRVKSSAKILDLRDAHDWETYQRITKGKHVSQDDFYKHMVRNGIDGLFDNSFGGLVIYNPSALEVMPDDSNPDIRYSRNTWYFSQLSKAIESAKFETAPANQWKLWLNSNAAKLGVKQDEIQWTGILDYLTLQQGKVSKADIQAYLDGSGVQVKDVMLGEGQYAVYDGDYNQYFESRAEAEAYAREQGINITPDTVFRASNRHGGYGTKYETYTVPGGKNYRELLLTLPSKRDYADKINAIADTDLAEADRLPALSKKAPDFKSSHFDQPNILAHVRFDERTDADGLKTLFIQEIQSDFGQSYKKQRDAIIKAVDNDFLGIVERMKKDGVLEVNCD